MMADLRRHFLPRFVREARARVRRAVEACGAGERSRQVLFAELHALGGEAALLELGEIAALAHEGEAAARQAGATDICRRVLAQIEVALDALEAGS